MSRIIQQIATVQFQVDNRKVTASMNALQTEAESLNGKIAAVKQSIKDLGDVPPDNKFLLEYQKQLRQLNSDLKDVTTAQRDLMKGVKAADQLWKAARTQDIESLSIKAIKAGQNGLRKRMENLRPELGGDEQKMYDAYKAVIDEADRVMNVFKSNYATVVQTIRDGGIVSEQAMKSTRDALRDLMESEKEGTAEHRQLAQQYDFLNESLANVAEMRHREKGEIVNANDARREALKLTEDGIAAARRERDMADAVIAGMQQEKSDLDQLRRFHEDRIAQTEREIAANQRLEEAEQDRLADVEKAMRYIENEDRKEASSLRKKADAARDESEAKKEAYEQQAEHEKLLRQHVKDTGDEVTALTAKIEALGKTEQQKADHTTNLAQVQELYNQKVEERIRLEKELKDIQVARYDDDPHIKQLNTEIAKLEELLAVSDKYKKQFAKMSDEKFESGYMGKDEGKRSIWEAQKYLESAYDDKLLKAPLAERDDLPNSPEYKAAAKRVADGIMQNAQENVRRVIFDQIKNGTWTAESMQEQLEGMRNMMYQAGNSELGLKDNPEYNAYKFIIAQMEKYIEVAKKVQEERKQIAGSDPFLETAQRESDYDKNIWPESLSRQKEKREYQEATGYTRWNEENKDRERRKSEELRKAEEEEAEAKRNLNEAKKESTQADQQSVDVTKQKAELERQLAEATKNHIKAKEDFEAQQEKTNKAQEKAYKAQEDAVALNEKAAKAEEDVAHQEERHAEAMDHQSERLRKIRAEGERLLTQWEQQKAELQTVDKAWADADVKQGEAEARKAQNQELTTKSIEDSIRKLKEANAVIDANSDEWEENTRIIRKLQQAQDEISQKQKEMMGEWMSYAEAEKFAAQAGTEGFIATGQQMQQAQQALERRRDALIKSIQVRRQEKNMTDEQKKALAAEEAQLEKVNAELKQMKFEMDNTNMSAKRMKEIIDNPSAAKNIEELGQAVKRAQAQLKMMEDTVGNTNEEYQEMAQKTKEAAQRQKELEVQFKASASAFDKAWSRLKTYVGLYVGASVAMNKLMGTMGDLMDLSDKMGEVRKTTGFTADEVGRLSGELKKFDTRTTLNGLLDLSVAAGQLGLKTEEDVLGFTEAANKLMVALPEMGREGATEMLKVALATGEIDKIRKQMEQGLIEGSSATAVAMEKVGSTIDRLRATSAATAPAITDFVKRVGAVGAQSGITIDQVAALGSTVDALGMRVEMSATALSRMIPAIKNNAFDVAKAIGVAPEYLRGLFDEAGGGMKAMLMIFQHIKDSGMSEDNIEKMLGMGNLKEIMKELNQQGARAGIVFSGLSQNVDTLREHLGTASDAYRENVAIQQEYEKMNETTMAKWERLKNEIEEMFVGDGAQRFLGGIIDGIREIVDLLTGPLKGAAAGLGAGLSAYKLGLGSLLEKMWDFARGEEDVTEKWKEWTEKLKDKDVWGIVTSGVIAAGVAIYTYVDSLQEAAREAAKFARDVVDEQNKVENLTKAIGDAKTKVEEADKEVEKARKAVDEAKKSLDGTKKSTDRLTEANSKLLVSEEKKRNEMATQKKLIETFNNEYGKYLGFMLSEVSSNYELIKARDLANTKLRETIALKRKEAALGRIEESDGEGRDEAYAALSQAVSGSIRKQVVTGHDKNGKEMKTWANDQEATTRLLRNLTKMAQAQNMTAGEVEKALADAGLNIYEKRNGKRQINTYGANLRNLVMNYRKEYQAVQSKIKDVETQFDVEASIDREEAQGKLKEQFKASEKNYADLETSYAKAQGDARKQAAANLLKQADTLEEMISTAPNYYDLSNDTEKAAYEKFVTDTQKRIDGIKGQRESLLKEAGALYKSRKTVQGETTTSLTPTSPWGGNAPAESTDYGTWDVNELVARRNQMDKFKNVLKPDTDIRAVLAEDKALMKALDNGLKEDWKSVLGWYNTERKKIQEELKSERFSTNEGHWRDEKQGRGRRNRFRESDYALAELDRYYSKRKEDLEKARIEENMSEELFNRQAELLEQEHLERRSKLRETFTAGSTEQEKKMVKQFREWWSQLEKQGLLDEVPWTTVESEWSKALASEIGRNNLRAQQDLTKLQEITVKHLNEIAKLIDKERPYDGITANLRKNLTEMDILLADMQKDGPEKDTAKLVKAETIRLKFLLSEAEQAYSLNFEQLKEKMVKEGFGEWAQAIEGDEQLKQSLMQNLRNTYDAIQEAIKKESSVIKKQLEIQWNDLMPGSDMSMKGTFEKAVSDLGLAGDQVKRANSLIGAGTASDRVADKLAIQSMRVQLQMQETYFALMQKIGRERIKQLEQSAVANEREAKALKEKAELLRKEGKTAEAEVTELKAQNALRQSLQDKFDAEHATKSLSLARTKELAEEEKQRVAIANQLEESQNRLYQELKSWADLLTSSVHGMFEAESAGNREYYNERAKLNLTGKGGPGAGTYIIIEDEGTEDAKAHYEYLDERQALERQHEIEQENARADAWKKVMDDINQKMNDTITDQLNAMLQNQSIDANTQALIANTQALWAQMGVETGETSPGQPDAMPVQPQPDRPSAPVEPMAMPSATPAPASTDQENTIATNANTAALNTLTQLLGVQPAAGTAGTPDMGTVAAAGTPMPTDGEVQTKKPFFQMTEEEVGLAMERIQQLWKAYNEGGVTALQEMAATLAEMEGVVLPPWQITEEGLEVAMERMGQLWQSYAEQGIEALQQMSDAMDEMPNKVPNPMQVTEEQVSASVENIQQAYQGMVDASGNATGQVLADQQKQQQGAVQTNKKMETSGQSLYARLTAACNLYGAAYQAMSNDNMDMSQKFQMVALQAAGNAAIAALTAANTENNTHAISLFPAIFGECVKINPIAGAAIFAALTAVIGGLMGMAASKVAKGKSEIAQVTKTSSAGAGRLSTGMLTYAEGNVNEFTDPASLTPGRHYNVDAADGRTYRAKYTGKNPSTHLTSGPEFHLAGERGREMIIDAGTTRQITMNESEIWHTIQTLSGGGRLRHAQRRGRGVRAFAEGNVDEFEEISEVTDAGSTASGMGGEQMAAFQSSLDRNNELLDRALTEGIHAHFDVYGKGGLIDSYDQGKKTVSRHGEKY